MNYELNYKLPEVKEKNYLFLNIPICATRDFYAVLAEEGIDVRAVVREAVRKIVEENGMLADYLQVFELVPDNGESIRFWAISNYDAAMTDEMRKESGEVYNVCFMLPENY